MHPLFHVLMTQPKLLAEHAQAYGELVHAEAALLAARGKRQALWGAVSLCCFVVAAVLTGVAFMFAAIAPKISPLGYWALIGGPLLSLLCALGCLNVLRVKDDAPAFDKLKLQLAADMQMLREIGAP